MPEIASALRSARQARGMTVPEAAGAAGVDAATWWRVETGRTVPRLNTALAMARAVGLSLDKLHDNDHDPEADTPAPGRGNANGHPTDSRRDGVAATYGG